MREVLSGARQREEYAATLAAVLETDFTPPKIRANIRPTQEKKPADADERPLDTWYFLLEATLGSRPPPLASRTGAATEVTRRMGMLHAR